MADVLLATCADLPDGEPGGQLLLDALAERGVAARFAAWDDPEVDWEAARLVMVRSTWDYDGRRDEFLAWCRKVGDRLVNSVEAIAWNTDKAYLVDLGQTSLPVVPTVAVDEENEIAPAVAAFAPAVVKPRVGAGGRGVVVFDGEPGGPEGLDESHIHRGPWVVQPLISSIRTEGETSVFIFGGDVVSQVVKLPAGEEIRVHEEFGGASRPVPVTSEAAQVACEAVAVAEGLLGVPLPYARADLMRLDDGTLALSELEITEPGLYLDVVPANAGSFADLVVDLLDATA
jgi:glutathione synthase/RimK-type ligase-like ATP-grasp enzyme